MIVDLFLVWIDRPTGLLCVPMLGLDRVDVIGRAVDAAKSRCPAGSKVHQIRFIGDVNLGPIDAAAMERLLNLSVEMAFQGLPNQEPTPAQRRLTDSIEALHTVLNQLYAEMERESRESS